MRKDISNITKLGSIIYTGDYGSGDELTWSQINIASLYDGYPQNTIIDQSEKTTVTSMEAMVSLFDKMNLTPKQIAEYIENMRKLSRSGMYFTALSNGNKRVS